VDFTVVALGTGPDQTDFSAFWRQHTGQGGVDWSGSALLFEAGSVDGYSAGSLHGTYGGAFEGGPLADQLWGDPGSNALHGLAGADLITGGGGDDFLEGGAGADQLSGGDGSDIMFGGARAGLADSLESTAPEQQYYLDQIDDAPGDSNKLDGGGGDDFLAGGEYGDLLAGGAGADYLLGGGGSDHLAGGDEDDVIYGDSSLHYRYIESPPGYLAGQLEIAFADGVSASGSFDDVILAGDGNDTLWGELGNDSLYGEAGDDTLVGDRYNDPVYFQSELPAFDTTSAGLDVAYHGDDRLFGGAGRDRLLGLGGDDLLSGGMGDDILIGGAGNDSYLFEPGGGLDVIEDDAGLHTLVFSGVEVQDLQIQFQGERVFVGIAGDQQGFSLSRDQWSNVRIALNSPESLIDRSSLDTVVLAAGGRQLLRIAGSFEFEETRRDDYLALELSDPNRPFLALGEDVSDLSITGIDGGRLGAVMHLAGASGPALTIDVSAETLQQAGGFYSTGDATLVSLLELEGDIVGSGNNDKIVGSPGPDDIDGQEGDDLLWGGEGDDVLLAGPGDDALHGDGGNDSLDGGPGADLLVGGPGNDLIHNSGPNIDSFVFADGDGDDLIDAGAGSGRVRLGEIRFAADVDPGSIAFSYMNGDAFIDYGEGNRVTLNTDGVYTARDNTISRYTVVSEADPGWVPVIKAEGYVGDITGTFGRDIIIGGEHIETIMPSYGDDIIEAGGGPDWIFLNDLYLKVEGAGIGHKIIRGQEGNDIVHTPLHQGLRFHYEPGDGHDTIEYDWSYSADHPYQLGRDLATGEFYFNAYGNDVIVFGAGIELTDLHFYRYDDRLQISLADGTGSVSIANYFVGLDNQSAPQVTQPEWAYTEGGSPDSLLDVGVPGLIPTYPLSSLAFADGSVHDLEQILQDSLEDRSGFVYGTDGHDLLHVGADKTVLALAGDDQIFVEGDRNSIDPGSGNDLIEILGADNVVQFGPGDGVNFTVFRVDLGATMLRLGEGISRSDIDVAFHPELPELLLITLPTGTDTMQLLALAADPVTGESIPVPGATVSAVHFSDGSSITGEELLEMASGTAENLIQGTEGKDVLVGTSGDDILVGGKGNDILEGLDGDDRFLVEGTGQGRDRFIGGNGSDAIVGSKTGDTFKLGKFLVEDSIEQIDGGEGVDLIIGTRGRNKFDFSETTLASIDGIEGGAGDDRIFGSAGDDTITGGEGNDRLAGGPGSDRFHFAAGDGRDLLVNRDSDGSGSDSLYFSGMAPEDLWFSRVENNLVIDVLGSDDQLTVRNWFTSGRTELDAVYAADHVLLRGQLEQLVQAMASYDVPPGVDTMLPQLVQDELEPLLASSWQAVA
jgi:Ca2+-binding RTX toxin-like protein